MVRIMRVHHLYSSKVKSIKKPSESVSSHLAVTVIKVTPKSGRVGHYPSI